jgi:hypothetical protein
MITDFFLESIDIDSFCGHPFGVRDHPMDESMGWNISYFFRIDESMGWGISFFFVPSYQLSILNYTL